MFCKQGGISLIEMDLRYAKPGFQLAMPVISKSGIKMLESGTTLTSEYIERLKQVGITSVFVVPQTSSPEQRENDSPSPRSLEQLPLAEAIRQSGSLLSPHRREGMKNNQPARQSACFRLLKFAEGGEQWQKLAAPFRDVHQVRKMQQIFYEIANLRPVTEELGVLWQTDRFLFEHSLRVGLFSGVMGLALKFDPDRLFNLVLSGLLLDIGMTSIPRELLRKKKLLSAEEKAFIRLHTLEGFRILSSVPGVSRAVAKCALLHHERYRGNGYPFGMEAHEIPVNAQIVGLADVYNALLSPRHHRGGFTPSETVEYLFAAGNYDFDLSLIELFLDNVYIFPVSTVVRLSSGQIGIVSEPHRSIHSRPIVKIIREADGTPVRIPYEVNLLDHPNVTIMETYVKAMDGGMRTRV